MKKVAIIMALLVLFMGCSKLKSAKRYVEAAKSVKKQVEVTAKTATKKKIEFTEEMLKKYYTDVKKLNEKYSSDEINFEVPTVAATLAGVKGKKLDAIIKENTDMTYEKYSQIGNELFMTQQKIGGLTGIKYIIGSSEKALESLSKTDTSTYTVAQKEEFKVKLAKTKKELEENKQKLDLPENKKVIEISELIEKIKKELDY